MIDSFERLPDFPVFVSISEEFVKILMFDLFLLSYQALNYGYELSFLQLMRFLVQDAFDMGVLFD